MNVEGSPSVFIGLLGFGALNVISLYTGTAPKLRDIRGRDSTEDADVGRQQLLDADIIVGGAAALIAIASSAVLKSVWPMVFLLGGFVLVSGWYHLVLNSPSVKDSL